MPQRVERVVLTSRMMYSHSTDFLLNPLHSSGKLEVIMPTETTATITQKYSGVSGALLCARVAHIHPPALP